MEKARLSKLQIIAFEMLKGKKDLLNCDEDTKTQSILDACDFAAMFLDLSEDPEMTWNKK